MTARDANTPITELHYISEQSISPRAAIWAVLVGHHLAHLAPMDTVTDADLLAELNSAPGHLLVPRDLQAGLERLSLCPGTITEEGVIGYGDVATPPPVILVLHHGVVETPGRACHSEMLHAGAVTIEQLLSRTAVILLALQGVVGLGQPLLHNDGRCILTRRLGIRIGPLQHLRHLLVRDLMASQYLESLRQRRRLGLCSLVGIGEPVGHLSFGTLLVDDAVDLSSRVCREHQSVLADYPHRRHADLGGRTAGHWRDREQIVVDLITENGECGQMGADEQGLTLAQRPDGLHRLRHVLIPDLAEVRGSDELVVRPDQTECAVPGVVACRRADDDAVWQSQIALLHLGPYRRCEDLVRPHAAESLLRPYLLLEDEAQTMPGRLAVTNET